MARSIAAISCDRCAPSESNAPAFTRVSIVARPQACGSTRSQKSNKLANGPPDRRAATIASAAPLPQPLIALRPNRIFPSAHGEIDVRAIHVRRHDLDAHPLAIFQVLDQRILALEVAARNIARQQRRHELDRVVRFQIRRLIGDQRVGGAVRFVEAVAGELLDLAEQLLGLFLVEAAAAGRPSMNSSRNLAMIGSFFLLIALMQL